MTMIFSPVVSPENGYILNGVANFTQSTNPTVRIGGGALVVGDRVYRTDENVDLFWNGTYWLSSRFFIPVIAFGGNSLVSTFSKQDLPLSIIPINRPVFIRRVRYHLAIVGFSDASNHYLITGRVRRPGTSEVALSIVTPPLFAATNSGVIETNLLLPDVNFDNLTALLGITLSAVGSPTLPQRASFTYVCHIAYT